MPMALDISKKSHWGTKSDPHSLPLTYQPRVSPLPDVVPFPSRDVWKRCCWKDSLTLGWLSPSPQEMMEIPGILIRERGELCWCQSWRAVARGMRATLLCSWRWITSKRRLLQIQRWSQPSGTGPRRGETGSLVPKPKQPQVEASKCLSWAASQRQFSILLVNSSILSALKAETHHVPNKEPFFLAVWLSISVLLLLRRPSSPLRVRRSVPLNP